MTKWSAQAQRVGTGAVRHHGHLLRKVVSTFLPALVPFAASLVTASAQADCRLEQMEIPVRIVDQRPIATVTLNGTEVQLLVDSGAAFSMLSESAASQLKLPLRYLPWETRIEGLTGRVAAQLTSVETMGLLGAQLKNMEFIVGGNEIGAGIMGVMGRNILSMADTEYDLAHGTVRLSFPKGECAKTRFAHWAGEAPVIQVPLDSERRRGDTEIRLEVQINGKEIIAVLDTGAPLTTLTLKAARRAGLQESDLTPSGRIGGAGEGRVKSWTGLIAVFELGQEKISASRLPIADTDNSNFGALVGLDYFLSHRIYVSRLQRQIYATWNGGPTFALARRAPGDYDTRYAALPADIAKDDADALARRGAAAIAAGQFQRALEDLNRACEIAPGVADYFYARARLHMTLGETQSALADLDKALELDPALADARLRRAKLQAALDNRRAAQADLQQLDESLPPSASPRAEMAQMFANFGQVPQALRQFDFWITSHPRDAGLASVLNNRCWMRTRSNVDLPLALRDCKQAVDIDGGAAAHHDSLGWTYLRMGDAASAKRAFDDAIRLQALPVSLYGRGLAQLRLNDLANSGKDLAAARNMQPLIDENLRKQGFEFVETASPPPVSRPE